MPPAHVKQGAYGKLWWHLQGTLGDNRYGAPPAGPPGRQAKSNSSQSLRYIICLFEC
jgi:hypothetical protein